MTDLPRSWEQLIELAEQNGERSELSAADQQIVARLGRTLSLLRADDGTPPPDHVRNRALRLMRRAPSAEPRGAGLIEQIVAVLGFDSRTAAGAAGVRGHTAAPRQLLFNAGLYDIDVQIVAQAGRLSLLGQVLARGVAPLMGQVQLIHGAHALVSTALDSLGEFSFNELEPGGYALQIKLADAEIRVPEVIVAL